MKNTITLSAIATCVCLFLIACKKNDAGVSAIQSSPDLLSVTSLIDLGMDEVTSADLDDYNEATVSAGSVSNDVAGGSILSGDDAPCKVVTYSPSGKVYPHIQTINYGSGCANGVGQVISGSRIYTVDADWRTAANGTRVGQMTFDKYVKDGIAISGSATSYVVSGAGTTHVIRRLVINITYRDAAGNTSTFGGDYHKTLLLGGDTRAVKDDLYEFSGGALGVEVHLPPSPNVIVSWKSTIDATLTVKKKASCAWRNSGRVLITVTKLDNSTINEVLDYGAGTCDNTATLTINNQAPQTVTLPLVYYYDGL